MYNGSQIQKLFEKIQVVRAPRHRLSTFGDTPIQYHLITNVQGFHDRARLRIGVVTAEKPAIITPEALREQFAGFTTEARDYAGWFNKHYGEALKGLEYQFKNEPSVNRIELTSPDELTKQLTTIFDREDSTRRTIIRGTDKLWELSLMKFIVEETLSSFASNIQELKERGFFDQQRDDERRRREVEHLLKRARNDRACLPELGKKLKDYGLFERYQDSFFQLISHP
jgi:hypothetical protein